MLPGSDWARHGIQQAIKEKERTIDVTYQETYELLSLAVPKCDKCSTSAHRVILELGRMEEGEFYRYRVW